MLRIASIVLALIGFAVATGTASAKPIRIGMVISPLSLQHSCAAAGGAFSMESAGGYSCVVFGPGGDARTVSCGGDGQCTGNCGNCGRAAARNAGTVLKGAGSGKVKVDMPSGAKGAGAKTGTNGGAPKTGPVVRDHRPGGNASGTASSGNPPAAPAPAKPSSGTPAGTVVRDHRPGGNASTTNVVVRDHRNLPGYSSDKKRK